MWLLRKLGSLWRLLCEVPPCPHGTYLHQSCIECFDVRAW